MPGDASIHEKEVLFSLLPVNVSDEGYDLYDGLGSYFDDAVEFEGKAARMEVTLVDLPPLLQIQLQVRPVTSVCPGICFIEGGSDGRRRVCSGGSSTARRCSRTSRRRTSSSGRRCTWIGSWTARTPRRRSGPRRSTPRSARAAIASIY